MNVILLYRYLQDTDSALISSVTWIVLASWARHQNPASLTKSSCPEELTSKVWNSKSDGTSNEKSTGENWDSDNQCDGPQQYLI